MIDIKRNKEAVNKSESKLSEKPEKYLTDMKELPSYSATEAKRSKNKEAKKEPEENSLEGEITTQTPVKVNENDIELKSGEFEVSGSEALEVNKKLHPFTSKDIVLGVVNLISIILLAVMLFNFPQKSNELRELRIKELKNDTTYSYETSELEMAKPKVEYLSRLFLDESGVVKFVDDIEKLKTEGGAISKISFAGQKAVVDKTGNFGIPIIIEFTGNWQSIGSDLQKIETLPYLYRPVKVNISYSEVNPEVIVYKYGIFLYVNESLGKTR